MNPIEYTIRHTRRELPEALALMFLLPWWVLKATWTFAKEGRKWK